MKNKIYKPKTIKECIDNLYDFLECDLWTKFNPKIKLKRSKNVTEAFYRQDFFKSEKEFKEYLKVHFDILREEINGVKK